MERVTINTRNIYNEKDYVSKHIRIKDHMNTGNSEDIDAIVKIKETFIKKKEMTDVDEFKNNVCELSLRLPVLNDFLAIDIINRIGDGEDINSILIDKCDVEYQTIIVRPGDLMWDFWVSKAYDELDSIIK